MIETINKICEWLPKGWEIALLMEKGAAWVELADSDGRNISLADTADKTIDEQLNDAVCVARGLSHEKT